MRADLFCLARQRRSLGEARREAPGMDPEPMCRLARLSCTGRRMRSGVLQPRPATRRQGLVARIAPSAMIGRSFLVDGDRRQKEKDPSLNPADQQPGDSLSNRAATQHRCESAGGSPPSAESRQIIGTAPRQTGSARPPTTAQGWPVRGLRTEMSSTFRKKESSRARSTGPYWRTSRSDR